MTFMELFQKLDVDSNAVGKGLPPEFNLAGDVSEDVLVKFIRFLLDTAMVLKTERKWHTGTPTEEGEYVVETCTGMHSVFLFKNGWWWISDEIPIPKDANDYIKAYGQKITPFEEAN